MGLRVLTIGSFDPLHSEHIDLFKWCRRLAGKGGEVIVGINSDHFIKRTKGRYPLVPENHREQVVLFLKSVDFTFVNHDVDDFVKSLRTLRPKLIVVGSDWHSRDYFAQTNLSWDLLTESQTALVYAPSFGRVHSSDFRKKIDGS